MSLRGGTEAVLPRDYQQALLDVATGWLRDAAEQARAAAPQVDVEVELVVAAPSVLLVDESRAARLVVVGSRGLGGFTGLLVGSVAVALGVHAHCPVAVVRTAADTAEPPAAGPVVVGVDGTARSGPAIEYAFDHASRTNSPLVAVHAWTDLTSAAPYMPPPPDYRWPDLADLERQRMAERMAGWQEKHPDVRLQLMSLSTVVVAANAQLLRRLDPSPEASTATVRRGLSHQPGSSVSSARDNCPTRGRGSERRIHRRHDRRTRTGSR